jgi:hypothetical protein
MPDDEDEMGAQPRGFFYPGPLHPFPVLDGRVITRERTAR